MIKQECIGIPDMILLLMIFCFKKIKIKAEIVLSPGGAYFFKDRLEATNVNVQLKKLNEYPGNASKLFQRVPPLVFCFLNVAYKTG